MTTISLPLLSQVRIASPCPARWEDMTGDAVTRHCAQCDLDVHNLSAMTADGAEAFLREKLGPGAGSGRLCARIFRRADGTILTADCPVGLALWRKRARWAAGRVAAALLFLATGGFVSSAEQRAGLAERVRGVQPFRAVCEWFNPKAPAPPPIIRSRNQAGWLGGIVCVSPQQLAQEATLKQAKIKELLDRIAQLRAAGRFHEALEVVDQVLFIEPENADASALRTTLILEEQAQPTDLRAGPGARP